MLKIINRYIGRIFTRCFLLVLSVLAFLFSFFEFILELDDVGKGHYQIRDAFWFIILTLPGRILDLIPQSSLLAGIIALGFLADTNELVAMQASGISIRRICSSVLVAALLPMLAAGILAEFVVPPLEQQARTRRLVALTGADITFTKSGFWARNGPVFIHVRKIHPGGIPVDVDIFEFDQNGHLRVFTHAWKADVAVDARWVLTDVEQRSITTHGVTTTRLPRLTLESFLSAEQITIQEFPPEIQSPSDLYQYIRLLQERGQNADQYELLFWQKVTSPLSTGALVLLSLSFVFGPTRSKTAGFRVIMGSIVAIAVHFLNHILGHLGLLFGLNLALITMAPIAAIFFLGLWLISLGP
ncbi:MAG: LPS export ABC transporter permease LptG [Rubrivivax sp.]|nr:LPS export ABC transporter permease LptG [Rubrivivax sp.]